MEFEEIPHLRGTSRRWVETSAESIPLDVAELDDVVAPSIRSAIDSYLSAPLGYPPRYQGSDESEAILDFYSTHRGCTLSTDAIWMVSSTINAIQGCVASLAHGAPVGYFAPGYEGITSAIHAAGSLAIALPMNDDGPAWIEVEASLKRCSGVVVCNPHNPTGWAWRQEDLDQLRVLLDTGSKFLISDEVHARLNQRPHFSVISGQHEGIELVVDGATKSHGLAGIGGGFVAGRDASVIQRLSTQNRHRVPIASGLQRIALGAAFRDTQWLKENLARWMRQRAELISALERIGFSIAGTNATYFVWARAGNALRILSDRGIVASPGHDYGGSDDEVRLTAATSATVFAEVRRRLL